KNRTLHHCAELDSLSLTRLASLQRPSHAFRIVRDDVQIRAGGLVGLGAALLPVAECAERDFVACREFFLRQAERAAQCLDARHSLGLGLLFICEWSLIRFCPSRCLDLILVTRRRRRVSTLLIS